MLSNTIIELLSRNELSLADLQLQTRVSMPTLRRAVQELVDHDWIAMVGQSTTPRGRPAMLFGLDDTTHLILGVHLRVPELRLVAANLHGEVLDEKTINSYDELTPDHVIQEIVEYTQHVEQQFPPRRILGMGIAAPGFTDPDTGEIISVSRAPTWQKFPIRTRIMASLGLPVVIANDIDCMAIAELLHSPPPMTDSLIYVGFTEGIKASIFFNGELYKGPFGNAGIIGRNRLGMPQTDQYEPIENWTSTHAVNNAFYEALTQLPSSEQMQYKAIAEDESTRVNSGRLWMQLKMGIRCAKELLPI